MNTERLKAYAPLSPSQLNELGGVVRLTRDHSFTYPNRRHTNRTRRYKGEITRRFWASIVKLLTETTIKKAEVGQAF